MFELIRANRRRSVLLVTGFVEGTVQACRAAGSALLFVSHDLRLADAFDRELDLTALNRAAVRESAAEASA